MNASLLYEIVLYLNSYYFGFFGICESAMFLIKLLTLPLPEGSLVTEVLILGFLFILEGARIFLGRKGNLTENSFPVFLSILLTIPSVTGVLYFFLWQTYILRMEWILCSIELSLQIAEFILALLSLIPFYKTSSY